ncbi:DUF2935 domain-containing protein [Halanaerobaculum tunisiense]
MNYRISRERLNLAFWMETFKEHTIFIQQGLACGQKELINKAQEFKEEFTILQNEAEATIRNPFETDSNLLEDSRQASRDLLDFKRKLLRKVIQCNQIISLYPLTLDHTVREVEEFLCLTTIYKENNLRFTQAILAEETFWLRIMKEHTQFLRHFLDPSEQTFISKTHKFTQKFSQLHQQASDLESMLQANPKDFPTVKRFTKKVVAQTKKLQQFKEESKELLAECKLLAITTPLFAEHLAHEAEHFLKVIKQIKRYFDHN